MNGVTDAAVLGRAGRQAGGVGLVLSDLAVLRFVFECGLLLVPYVYLPLKLFPSDQQPYYLVWWFLFILAFHVRDLLRMRIRRVPLAGISLIMILYLLFLSLLSAGLWDVELIKIVRRAGSSVLVPLLIVHAVLLAGYLGYTRELVLRRVILYSVPVFAVGIAELLTLGHLFPESLLSAIHGIFVWREPIADRPTLVSTEPSYAVALITFLLYVWYLLHKRLKLGLVEGLLFAFLGALRSVTGVVLVVPVLLLKKTRALTTVLTGVAIAVPTVGLAGLYAYFAHRVESLSIAIPGSLQFRWAYFLSSYYGFIQAPWFGIGLGRYEDIWLQLLESHGYRAGTMAIKQVGFYQPHQHTCPAMGVLTDTGIIGGVLFAVFLILLFRLGLLNSKEKLSLTLYAAITLIAVPPLATPYLWVLLAALCLPTEEVVETTGP